MILLVKIKWCIGFVDKEILFSVYIYMDKLWLKTILCFQIFYHIFGAFYFGLYHLSFGFLVIRKSDYKMKVSNFSTMILWQKNLRFLLIHWYLLLQALYQILVLIIWASKNIMVVIISCINCERFYKTIENVNSISLILMQNENCSGEKSLEPLEISVPFTVVTLLVQKHTMDSSVLPHQQVETFLFYIF